MTAYFGMRELGVPKPGETVVVSAASGAVGSIAGQIAKIEGCRVVGLAGSNAKCEWLVKELGFDVAVNYRDADWKKQLRAACPKGIDIDFENVGGCDRRSKNGNRQQHSPLERVTRDEGESPGPMFREDQVDDIT